MTEQEKYLKENIEAILGREVDLDVLGGISLRHYVGAQTWLYSGTRTSREWEITIGATGASTKSCEWTGLLECTGSGRTGADGSTQFLLSDYFGATHFRLEDIAIEDPVNFIATPLSTSPVFPTSLRNPTNDGHDVRFTVMAWDPAGAPAPDTSFDWRCRVPFES